MESVRSRERKKSRPVSELITLFDHQQFVDRKIEQWQSEKTLNSKTLSKTADKEMATIAPTRSGNSESSKRELSEKLEKSAETAIVQPETTDEEQLAKEEKAVRGEALGKTMITLTLKPKKTGAEKDASTTTKDEAEKKRSSPKTPKHKLKPLPRDAGLEVPKALEKSSKENAQPEEETDEIGDRKKYPLDCSLAELRREMHSLRKQDVELMSQLLALNSSIQNFRYKNSNSLSDLSDISDETEATYVGPASQLGTQGDQGSWIKRSSSASDESDYDARDSDVKMRSRGQKLAWQQNRESMGSEVSGYYSYTGSPYGSDSSLNRYNNTGSETPLPVQPTGSEIGLPVYPQMYPAREQAHLVNPQMYYEDQRRMPPRIAQHGHHRQPAWPHREGLYTNDRAGSDPSLCAGCGEEDSFPVHNAQSYFAEDVRVKRKMFYNQNRRHSAVVTGFAGRHSPRSLSRSGSEHSLYGYDVSSDESAAPLPVPVRNRMQKWQRSKSSSALNSPRGTPPAVQRTVRVDLRDNVPAIELVLPIQPVKAQSPVMRMAERRPLNKLNTMNKRQSMIW